MHPEEDEKRTEVRVHNTPGQSEKDGENGKHWLRRTHCCCSQEFRYDLRARSGGLAVVEILPVVVIIAIGAYLDYGLMRRKS